MTLTLPEKLYAAGFTDLVSVIPPNSQLQPSSKIPNDSLGKIPGRKMQSGLWAGYGWTKHNTSAADVAQWAQDGANFGLRADRFPAVDVDCTDPDLAAIIEAEAFAFLGPAPVRTGLAPKRLLMYRTDCPFTKMRVRFEKGGQEHVVEILGQGQQYVVLGIHPKTLAPYSWGEDVGAVKPEDLTRITREMVEGFLARLGDKLATVGVEKFECEGNGKVAGDAAANQDQLLAPSLDLLRRVMRLIPNTNEHFADRSSYIKVGNAIHAAGREDLEEAFAIFAEWTAKWTGNARTAGNDPATVLSDWGGMRAPHAVGWQWLAEQAQPFGFDSASLDFDVHQSTPDALALVAPHLSDQWLADIVAARQHGVLRYVPQRACWLVWSGARWEPDAELLAEDIIQRELRAIANREMQRGATDKEKHRAQEIGKAICAGGKVATVGCLIRSYRSIAVSAESLDYDHWLLNTPSGIVDLRTGQLSAADPDALCTKTTRAAPLFGGACPQWKRFLAEATGDDNELIAYLRRLCGYALTGDTREQHLTFIYGTGGNGKGTFLNTLRGILGDYAQVASMDTFTASYGSKHSTEIAMLAGARLVTASETEEGKRWDESKVKSLTGGDPVTARLMRQDNFTFIPQFKLIFVGNHAPEIRTVDRAMRRRIQMVGFDKTPARIDNMLNVKLQAEWPAILAWMIEGCIEWQKEGLAPPACVRAATEEYFSGEDAVGRWLEACCEIDGRAAEPLQTLFESWREWANRNGEFTGPLKRLSAALVSRGFTRNKHPKNRRISFVGLRLVPSNEFALVAA